MRKWFFFVALIAYWITSSNTDLSTYESLSVGLFTFFFLDFLNGMGNKLVIFDLVIIITILTCLIMPAFGYHVYNKTNHLATIWIKYMFVPSDQYYSFMFPAVCAMIAGFRLPLGKTPKVERDPVVYMQRVEEVLRDKPKVGTILIGVGLVSGVFTKLVPESLAQFFLFLSHLMYVGVFYVLYSPSKNKRTLVPIVFIIMIGESVAIGMFGELIFFSAVSLILILLGKKVSFSRKLAFALTGVYFILLLQSMKLQYRQVTWRTENGGAVYFAQLLGDRIANPDKLLEPNTSFLAFVRLNQGWLIGVTMYNVPKRFPYANGETIWQSVAASIVPRFLWPGKPEAGGRANLLRFWGYKLHGYSMNIGPFGEAYGNFGSIGGIVFMFFYGIFFNFMLKCVLNLSHRIPTLVLWIPFLFTGTMTVESDLLTVMGLILKGFFFTWLIFKIFKAGFHIDL